MKDWNPDLYKKFEIQRTLPVKDLINSITVSSANKIIDIGCGPGNSTEELLKRWGNASIIGIDTSENMIKQAQERVEQANFYKMDASKDLSKLGNFDVIFSNAVIQWIPNHKKLLNNFFNLLNSGGVIAIQLPYVKDMAIQKAVKQVAEYEKWTDKFDGNGFFSYDSISDYYEICSKLSPDFYLWETSYYHIMESHKSIIDWYKSTGMKPYLDNLENDNDRKFFEDKVLSIVKKEYDLLYDGRVLFPFRRLFMTIYK